MNVVQKVINDIKRRIPKEVLEIAFLGKRGRNGRFAGQLDYLIKTNIIDTQVREDCDLLGAVTDNIPLRESDYMGSYDSYKTVLRVNKRATEGRSIVEVLAFNYNYGAVGTSALNNGYGNTQYDMRSRGNSPLMRSADRVLKSATPPPITSTTAVRLLGENIIGVDDFLGVVRQGSVSVRMAGDEGFSHIRPATVPQFSKLCLLAAKMIIYNEVVVNLDDGYLDGGSELGAIARIVESYADAAELYSEYFVEEWTAVNFMNDESRHQSYLRNIMGGQG